MERYRNLGGDSGVAGYEIRPDAIIVQFSTGARYTYTYGSAGQGNVEQMKQLATAGHGLNAFINRAKPGYASKG